MGARRAERRPRRWDVVAALPGDPREARSGVLRLLEPFVVRVDVQQPRLREEIRAVLDSGITDEELSRGKGSLKGSLVLGLEDTSGRMSRLGKGELCHGEILSPDEMIARIDGVTREDV